jgi:hypothetical protein
MPESVLIVVRRYPRAKGKIERHAVFRAEQKIPLKPEEVRVVPGKYSGSDFNLWWRPERRNPHCWLDGGFSLQEDLRPLQQG